MSSQTHVSFTCLLYVFPGLRLREGGDLVKLGVNLWMFKAAKVDTLAVNHTVRQLFREMLLGFLGSTKTVFNRLEKQFDIHLDFIFTSFLRWFASFY